MRKKDLLFRLKDEDIFRISDLPKIKDLIKVEVFQSDGCRLGEFKLSDFMKKMGL